MNRQTRKWLGSVLLVLTSAGWTACGGGSSHWESPQVVKVETKEFAASLIPSWITWLSAAEDGQPQALLLRDGDYMFASFDAPFRYLASDGTSLKTSNTEWSGSLGDTIVALQLDKGDAVDWLSKASDRQLGLLRIIDIKDKADDKALAALKRLAAINPGIDLGLESEDAIGQILPLFKPKALFLGDGLSPAALSPLANQPQIETLLFGATASGMLDVLPKLTHLKRLIIGKWDVKAAGPLPAGLSNLRSLMVVESGDFTNAGPIANAPAELEELCLLDLKELTDISGLSKFIHLHTLTLLGDEGLGDLSGLANHQDLRWVGMPAKTTQEQFAAFLGAHANLRVLDLMRNKNITSLTPIAGLTQLEGLILDGPYENLSTVQSLATLRYVGVSKQIVEKSPDQVAAIRKALPNATVVRVAPLCLGSGWILLLIPMIVPAWIVQRRRARAR